MDPEATSDAPPRRVVRATRMLESDVQDGSGEKIGSVEEVVLDEQDARAAYAIVSLGGLLGFGEKHFAIPFPAVQFDDDDEVITLAVPKHVLEQAPSFDRDAWPRFDRAYGATIYDYYKTPLYWTARLANRPPTPVADETLAKDELAAHGMTRASSTLGATVLDASGRRLGPIDDVIFDAASGRIAYVVLAMGGFLGIGDRLFAVPGSALRPGLEARHRFVLDVARERVANARGFTRSEWPDMTDPRFALALHAFYERPPYWAATSRPHANTGAAP